MSGPGKEIPETPKSSNKTQKHSSMYLNGWRPVSVRDEFNFNGPPSNKIQRLAAPLHPVISKLQKHLGTSDTEKLHNRKQPPELAPPSILGSFSIIGHTNMKAQEDRSSNLKLLPSETRKYSFLLPPNRDPFYSPETKFVSRTQKPDTRESAGFYSNAPRYSSTSSPLESNRLHPYTYNVQQTLQAPERPASANYDYQSHNKQYLIPPNVEYTNDFEPSNNTQNNFFNYIGPSNPHKVSYERNPSHLIHESHELSYVTPSFQMKFKPYQNYVMPPGVYTSTSLPTQQINYHLHPSKNVDENHSEIMPQKLKNNQTFDKEFRKTHRERYEQVNFNDSQNSYTSSPEEDFVYIPPETQQYFRQTITPFQKSTVKEYETPESISLKHYNDQIARLAIEKNKNRFGAHEAIKQQDEDYYRQQEERKLFERQQKLKTERERTRGSVSGIKKKPNQEEYHTVNSAEPQKVSSGHRYASNEEKNIELHETTVTERPSVSHHRTTTHPTVNYYPSILPLQEQNYEYSQGYWEENVQYPQETLNSTEVAEKTSQKQSSQGKSQFLSYYPASDDTKVSIHSDKTRESVTEIPVHTTIVPKRTTISPTGRTRTHVTAGKRRRRPTAASQELSNTSSKTKQAAGEYENSSENFTRRNQAKRKQSKNEEATLERKSNSRKRPEVVTKLDQETITETVIPTRFENPRDEIVHVTKNPNTHHYQKTSTESIEEVTENQNFEYVTEVSKSSRISKYEYVTEPSRPPKITHHEYVTDSIKPTKANNYEYITEPTSSSRVNNEEVLQKTDYTEATLPTTSTTSFSTTKESQISTSTTPSPKKTVNRTRPTRPGNTARPRFSVKQYKSRLDYKNRISQISTTEASPETTQVKQRPTVDFKKKQQSEPSRDTTGKYKYMSRVSYKTSSTTPATEDLANTTFTTYTRNKINKFSSKPRPNNSYLYRSRTTSTTSDSIKQDIESNPTSRPENLYSSSIRHRSSATRSKSRLVEEPSESKDEVEMATEETSFYSLPTSQPESFENQANEVIEVKFIPSNSQGNEDKEISNNQENVTINAKLEHEPLKIQSELDQNITSNSKHSDEELFEKASQSVADLTSSASALYNQPGLFKAVSPSTESRVISTHLTITTGEPTLPIEAFFQSLSEKV